MELSQVLQALRNADAAGDQEAARRLAQIAQQLQTVAPAAAKPPAETTVGGNVREFFKGLAPGAIGLLESAATGASALLPEETERRARAGIASLAQAAKAPFAAAPGYEEAVGRKFGEATGSIGPFFALGPLGLAGRAGMAALGTGAGAGEARVRAEQESATAGDIGTATALGSVVGISEMFAPLRILGRLDEPLKQGIANRLRRVATAGGEEAAQEASAQIAQNLIAKGIYKPDQAIIEQVGESAAYGGAVGALAQGLLDLALGRRAKGVTTQDEIAKARAEADAAAEAEKARKESPEYAQQFVADYEARRQAFLDARKELKRPGKDATPDVWAAFKEQEKAVKELKESLDKDAKEYNQLAPKVKEIQRQTDDARAAALETETAGMGEAAQAPYYMPPPVTPEGARQPELPGFGGAVPRAEPAAPAPEFVDYASQIRNLAAKLEEVRTQAAQTTDLAQKRTLNTAYTQYDTALKEAERLQQEQIKQAKQAAGVDDKISALVKKMAKAEEQGDVPLQNKLVEQLQALGVTDLAKIPKAPEQAAIPLQPFKTKVSTRAEYAAVAYPPGPEDVESQERDYLAEAERQREEALRDAEREQKITPEVLALRRIKAAEAPAAAEGVQRRGQISGLVDRLVDNVLRSDGTAPGRVITGAAPTALSEADVLRAQLAYATAARDNARAQTIRTQLREMQEPETSEVLAGDLEFGLEAKEAGVEGRLSKEAMQANRITRLSAAQLDAYDRLADYVQTVREMDQNEAEAKKDTLRAAAEKLKDTVTGLALNEIVARRAQAGMPELDTAQLTKAAGQINGVVNELVSRGAGLFNVIERPAVTRGTLTLRSAEKVQPPTGMRLFGNFDAAANALRAQMRSVLETVGEIKAPEPRKVAPRKARKADELLRMTFAGRERSVKDQFAAAYDRAKTDEDYRTLKELEKAYPSLSEDNKALALEQARRVELGQDLSMPAQLSQALTERKKAGESDAVEQAELFTGTSERGEFRATTNNFIRFLRSGKVQQMRAEIAKAQKAAANQAKRAAALQRRVEAEAKKQTEIINKLVEPWFENPVEAARKQFKKVVDRNQAAVAIADQINKQRVKARVDVTSQVVEAENALFAAKKNAKNIDELYDFVVKNYINNPRTKKAREDLAFYEQQQVIAAQHVEEAQKAVDAAKEVKVKLLEKFAEDTVDNALLSAGAKAQRKIDRAQQAVKDAQAAESVAKKRLDVVKAKPEPKQPSVGAALETTYVYRDTSDADVQAKVAAERKNVAKAEAAYETATTAEEKQKALADIEAAYAKMYEILNNAPVRREVRLSKEQIAAQEDFDRRQQSTIEQTVKLFEEKAGIKPMKLAQRKVEGVVRVKGGAPRTAISQASVAKMEEQFLKEQESGVYPAATLEKLADARAKRAELQAQIDYIDANKAEPRTPARAKQNAARTKAVAERNKLDGQIKQLEAQQKAVVREAVQESKASKAVRKESKRLIREAGRLQEAIEGAEESEVFAETVSKGKTLFQVATEVNDAPRVEVDPTKSAAVLMANIAKDSKTPLNRAVAERLKGLLGKTEVRIVKDLRNDQGGAAYGAAGVDGSYISLDADSGLNEQTILHEGVHAAVERTLRTAESSLTKNQLAAKRELEALYNAYAADAAAPNDNAKESLSEFVADALSDPAVQIYMQSKKWTLKNMWNAFKNSILKLIGIDTPTTMLEATLAAADTLMLTVARPTKATTERLFSKKPEYASPEMEAAGKKLDPFVTKQRGVTERVRAASGGFLGLETMLVDRFAGFERLSKYLPDHLGTQMMYYLRMYDQRMNMVSEAVANGAPSLVTKTRKDGKTERLIEAKEGPNIKRVVEILRDANPMVGNAEAVNRLFTAYMAGIRADNKGFATLNFGEDVTPEMLKDALSVVNNNLALKEIFDNARSEYNAYNRNLVEFLVETGAISRDVANRLMAENDYIPFYRERGGVAELLIGKEAPIKIGSIKEQPYLQELVGGDQPILDFLTSSVQNTNFLVDMGMRNLATKNAVFELVDLGAAKIVGGVTSGTNVVKFKDNGKDKYAVLATEKVKIGNKEFETGVPADILVKGMEGVPTQMPALLRAFALPAQLLRKGVTLSPLYIARQIFRDSLAAPILAGANFTPVLGALRQIGKPTKEVLERRGITGGQQFTGTSDDLSMILRDVADGKPGWMSLLAKAEGIAMSADALTRRAQYNSYIEQGLSEMEATLMSLESMNFSKRGASPSIQIANSMIPFFNAQIQGLNVLYKALMGKMPMNDKLKLREKLLLRGGMMAAASMVYAIMMQDDEAYKNAEADQKYANWFVRVPGVDEPVRIPIPFEIGYIFKALPEAIVNSMASEEGGAQALKALKQIVIQTIPGGSSYGIPQALKPAIEAGLGKSFYTGRDILSAREKELLPEEQFRTNTAEISKLIGQQAGVSPIILENLVRGYTGTMGLAFLHALSLGVPPGEGPEKAVKRLSEYPVVGGAFQPNDAGAIVNSMYERMNDALKVERTYEKLVVEGRTAEANALLQRKGQEFMQAELANEFKANMNQITAAERAIQASNMSAEEKRKQLDDLRKLKIAVAKELQDVANKVVTLSSSL